MIKYSYIAFAYEDELIAMELKYKVVGDDTPMLIFSGNLKSLPESVNVVDEIRVFPAVSDTDNKKIICVANTVTHISLEIDGPEDIIAILVGNSKEPPTKNQRDIIEKFIGDVDSWFIKKKTERGE